jgi:hypothetical protein
MDFERYSRQLENLERERAKIVQEIAGYQEQLEEQAKDDSRAERLVDLANHGTDMLKSQDIAAANAWLRQYIRIWIDNDNPEARVWVEYL